MAECRALNLIIRGHIRSSFDSLALKNLVEELSRRFELNIHVQTWSVFQNNISWRKLEEIPKKVSSEAIESYLGIPVKSIQIIEDGSVRHVGNTEGKIGRTPCPVIAWKNMYYGMLSASSNMFFSEDPNGIAVQMRFDILSNPFSPSAKEVIDFAEREYMALSESPDENERVKFLRMRCFLGVDNIYMARVSDMHRFISYMYYDMDRILDVHRRTVHQEHIAFHERRSFFNWVPPGDLVERLLWTNKVP